MLRSLLLSALLLGAPATSFATTGLEWSFAEPARYHLDATVELAELRWVYAERNDEARISAIRIGLVTQCAPSLELGKRGWELDCKIEKAVVVLGPTSGEREAAQRIAEEWSERLSGATAHIVLLRDGRVRAVDLRDVPFDQVNQRTNGILEVMRQFTARAFASLDLQFPKKGDDKGTGAWKQRETQIFGFPSQIAAVGSADVRHEISQTQGDLVDIRSVGRGTMGSGDVITVAGVEQPKNLFDMTVESVTRFDTKRGAILSRDYVAFGTFTSSSVGAEGRGGFPYIQSVMVRWLAPDAPALDLGGPGLLERVAPAAAE